MLNKVDPNLTSTTHITVPLLMPTNHSPYYNNILCILYYFVIGNLASDSPLVYHYITVIYLGLCINHIVVSNRPQHVYFNLLSFQKP